MVFPRVRLVASTFVLVAVLACPAFAADSHASGADTAVVGAHDQGEVAAAAHGEGHRNQVDAIHHVVDSREIEIPWPNRHLTKVIHLPSVGTFHVGSISVDMAITKHVVFLWVAAILLFVVVSVAAAKRSRGTDPPRGITNLIEIFVAFIRDEITVPSLGPHYGRVLLPYFLTAFFFILFCNLLGLVPYGSTATGNISVTAALATLSFFVIQGVAISSMGFGGWIKHLTGGVHWALWPIMIPVEIMGLFTKPFALCVRLFANMTAGHVVILSILGLIFIFRSVAVAGLAVPFSVFIYLLELLVAFIQAYVFTMLSAVFAGLGVHSSHDSEEAEAH
ncbi:MAG: ATP synthase subunit a [Candidatus Latescibacteria bacterium ADurb.Bin168]|nr:MAG: ATP synthase subunit a [Candidatus Latescibacteria bacterium ADurb.Bin168]